MNWQENHKLACEFREKKRKEFLEGKLPQDQEFIIRFLEFEPIWKTEEGLMKLECEKPRPRYISEEPLSLDVRLKLSPPQQSKLKEWNKSKVEIFERR